MLTNTKPLDVRIIALDLDDTLLTEMLTITPYTVDVLAQAARRGIYIALCSGRAANAVIPYVRQLGEITEQRRYVMTQNGGVIKDLLSGETIHTVLLPGDILVEAYRLAKTAGLSCHVYDDATIFSPELTRWIEEDHRLSSLKVNIVEDYEELLMRGFPKIILSGPPEQMVSVRKILDNLVGGRCTIFVSKPYFMELVPVNSGKGEALEWLSTRLGIPREAAMAFGDSMNDESMIRYAYHSVAMCNGRPEIRAAARYTTEFSNNDDGVARFIEKYVR
ncbi:MAG: Cof-type HAD-IIB family hydrolase [Spirochaetaceae bacterium]|jgi:Cof subfamily protein (haloacid dehalogenase superfamily)|nr:Cof-type HAD-IIB family hydrolase [Spirochaetaceae bacterium]